MFMLLIMAMMFMRMWMIVIFVMVVVLVFVLVVVPHREPPKRNMEVIGWICYAATLNHSAATIDRGLLISDC